MNHSFVAAPWNKSVCMNCACNEELHGDNVVCDACSTVGPIEIVGKLKLCKSCEEKERIAILNPVVKQEQTKLSLEQVVNQVDRLCESNQIVNQDGDSVKTILDEAIKGDIRTYKDFFNAKMPSINELEKLIQEDDSITEKKYALAIALRKRVSYLARVLFQTRASQIEIGAEVKTIQHYMSEMIPKLRTEMRQQFATETPNYTPQVVPNTKKVRAKAKSPEEKLAESYARSMKIPYEQALKKIRAGLKQDCVCAVTPGLCKVHNA